MNRHSNNSALHAVHSPAAVDADIDTLVALHTAQIDAVIKLLNDSLAAALVSALRYRCHHYTARAVHAQLAAEQFMAHATAKLHHVDLLAERIVQLGGTPNFLPDELTQRSHTGEFGGDSLASMVRQDLTAAGIVIDDHRSTVARLGENDFVTRHILEGILADEEEHADVLSELLVARFRASESMLETHRQKFLNLSVTLQHA